MSSLKWFCCLWCLLALGAPSLNCGPSMQERKGLSALDCYLVQMHIHGHSNHNGNVLPASMESHCSEAKRNRFDVIWWTDHARLFETYDDIKIDFKSAWIDTDASLITFVEGRPRELTRIYVEKPPGEWPVHLEDGRLRAIAESRPGQADFEQTLLTLGSERGKVHTIEYCRTVTSGLMFRCWGYVDGLEEDTYLRFGFDFSLHPKGQHHARFDAVSAHRNEPAAVGDTTVVYEIELPYGDLSVSLDLEDALSYLTNGDDNTLSSCYIAIGARNGKSISVVLDSLAFVSSKASGENQYRVIEDLIRRYSADYGVAQYAGVEIGQFHTPRLPHMNAYFPDSTRQYASVTLNGAMRRDLWVEEVHKRGGLVSLNHPFGASLIPRRKSGPHPAAGSSVRDLWKGGSRVSEADFWEVAKPIIEDDGLGADILEVGYLFRGIGSLEDHLRLWDLALANGVGLVGNGTSDSHGGIWDADMVPNPFATWIWARSRDAGDLLKALKAGRVAFGDPFLWQGKFAFGVEDAIMGDTLLVDGKDEVKGWILMEPWRDDVEIRLIQIKIEKGKELAVMTDEAVDHVRDGFPIYVDEPCFVRTEIYRKDGTPLVFSNPVFILPK